MKIVTLLARFGLDKYQEAPFRLRQIFETQLSNVDHYTVVVDNALPADLVKQTGLASTLIGGDNSAWEFSAWNKGLNFLGQSIWSYDLVHLATSAFNSLYTDYLALIDEQMLRAIEGRSVCLGHIDFYNKPVDVLSFRSQHWIRSSFVFAPPTEIKLLRSLVSVTERSRFFDESDDRPFGVKAEISSNYQRYMIDWLTGGDIGQGITWHSKFALNPSTMAYFQAKATAILNEHLFSIRLRAQGTHLIDTTWLAGQLRSKKANEIEWSAPWQEQLATRIHAVNIANGR